MSGFETTVQRCEEWLGQSLFDTGQYDTERSFLRAVHDELRADDVVWVVGARDGLYAALAAAVVGAENVAVFEDDPNRRERVRETLSSAGTRGVRVESLTGMPVDRQRAGGDPGVAGPDSRGAGGPGNAPVPESPTVLVLDEPAAGHDLLDRLSVGHLLGVRYLLVKGEDREVDRRLRAAGYETTRRRQFDPLRTPWMQVVEARRDPELPVRPVPTAVVGAGARAASDDGSLGTRLTRAAGIDPERRPQAAAFVTGLARLGLVVGGFVLISAVVALALIAGVGAVGGGPGWVPLVAVGAFVLVVLLFDLGTPEEEEG